MKIYTKKGDQGYTQTLKGDKIPKNHEIIQIMGKIDALQSSLDIANITIKNEEIKKIIQEINDKLWQTAGEISNQGLNEKIKNPITKEDIQLLELQIDKYHPKNNYFIRFTKDASTKINESRIRTRELESQLTKQLLENKLRPEVYEYINRLSDLFYALACNEEQENQDKNKKQE